VALFAAGLAALTFVAGERAQARRDRGAPPPARTTLTFRKGYLTGARFAPDGQTIVYSASWDATPTEIFTTRVGSTESRPLRIERAGIFAVSSKGELAVSLDCDSGRIRCVGTLARVPLAGGTPRSILNDVASADWSDGQRLRLPQRARILPVGGCSTRTGNQLCPGRARQQGFPDIPSGIAARVLSVDRAGDKRILTGEFARLGPILWGPTGEEVFFSRWGGGETRGVDLSGRTRSASWIPGLDDVSREGRFLDSGKLLENFRRVILGVLPGAAEERNLSWLAGSTAADFSGDGTAPPL
jgi:hypothetical protein